MCVDVLSIHKSKVRGYLDIKALSHTTYQCVKDIHNGIVIK